MRISDWSSDVCSSDLTLKAVTKTLSSDAFGGRAPTTPAEERTIGYIAKQFAAAGLQPGNNGSWYQDVPLVEITPANDAALTVSGGANAALRFASRTDMVAATRRPVPHRSEEHTSELQSLMRISYAVFCLKKKKKNHNTNSKLSSTPDICNTEK